MATARKACFFWAGGGRTPSRGPAHRPDGSGAGLGVRVWVGVRVAAAPRLAVMSGQPASKAGLGAAGCGRGSWRGGGGEVALRRGGATPPPPDALQPPRPPVRPPDGPPWRPGRPGRRRGGAGDGDGKRWVGGGGGRRRASRARRVRGGGKVKGRRGRRGMAAGGGRVILPCRSPRHTEGDRSLEITAARRRRRSRSGEEKASWASRHATEAGRATRLGLAPWRSSHALVNPSNASATRSVAQGLGKPAAR